MTPEILEKGGLYCRAYVDHVHLTQGEYDPEKLDEYDGSLKAVIELQPYYKKLMEHVGELIAVGKEKGAYDELQSFRYNYRIAHPIPHLYWTAFVLGLFTFQGEDPTEVAKEALKALPEAAKQYKEGNVKALGALIGYCAKNKAEPKLAREALIKLLA